MKILKLTFTVFILFIITVINNGKGNAQTFNWSVLGTSTTNGTNGKIYALTSYNGNIVAAGGFTQAGGINARNIAMWNGSSWSPLGNGIGTGAGDTVYALTVYNGTLYAGGIFATASGVSVNNVARWDGANWYACGTGTDGEVRALVLYNTLLIAGGEFGNAGSVTANRIASWNGTAWSGIGGGFNTNNGAKVFSLAVYNLNLIAGGRFNTAGGTGGIINIAQWNGSTWSGFGGGLGTGSDRVFALAVNNSSLFAGGRFAIGSYYGVAQWNGSSWISVGNGVNDDVNALASFEGKLIAGGNFKYANGTSLYVDRISMWDGSSWSRMLTGMNEKVQALYTNISGTDTSLYAGGEFTTAGGRYAYHIARWNDQQTSIVSGTAKYSDNNQPVSNGKVKILRRDVNTQEVIVVDSAIVTNGSYSATRVPRDSTLRVIIFPNDEFDHFVPTYFPSTIDWAAATPISPVNNLINIDVSVFRYDTTGNASSNLMVGGYAYLNLVPPMNQPGNYPYNSDAIVYLKQGNIFKGFGVSNTTQQYNISHVPAGTYDATVYRVGYEHESRQISVASVNLDTVNFYLDTNTAVIGIQNISSQVPSQFTLSQNYPNPFNPSTKIKFSLTKWSFADMKVYNVLGQQVAILVSESLKPGTYEVSFNALNLPSGIYFYKLVTNDFSETKKMILIK